MLIADLFYASFHATSPGELHKIAVCILKQGWCQGWGLEGGSFMASGAPLSNVLDLFGDSRDALYLRQNMLRAVLALLSLEECSSLNERLVVLLPAAAYALCVGSATLINETLGLSRLLHVSEAIEEGTLEEEESLENLHELFECSVEFLARIDNSAAPKVNLSEFQQHIRLPRQLRDQLLHEMENYVLQCISEKEIEKLLLSELINICALLSNFMYCLYSTRIREEISPFFFKLGESMLELLGHAISVIDKTYNDFISGCLGMNSIFSNIELTVTSFKSFIRSPLLSKLQDKTDASAGIYPRIVQSAERLLKSLVKLYEGCSGCRKNFHAKITSQDLSQIHSAHDPVPSNSSKSLILDMELDMNSGSSDVDSLTIDGDQASGVSISLLNQKLEILSIMSSFFSVLPSVTWEVLFNLKEKESDPKVKSMTDVLDTWETLKLQCSHILGGICSLVGSLLLLDGAGKHENAAYSSRERVSEECLISLGDLVNKVFENSFLGWYDRTKLVDCICNFISLRPQIAQFKYLNLSPVMLDEEGVKLEKNLNGELYFSPFLCEAPFVRVLKLPCNCSTMTFS
ncbi:UNVERIFIED_CONTAM: Serine/threonine-protein kinase ATM [Sesamum radiatum]|uniref:Serine/threonine-protein kinase ATM n=1 Tax=Sesamum radiatum TaxID=300843 RepID=A0AAW2WHE7_SESRA